MKLKSLFILSLLACIFLSWKLLYGAGQNYQIDPSSLEINLRNIGHQLLLQSADSSSRVLPIKRISESSYQIQFESHFAMEPDTLVSIVNRNLSGSDFPAGYLVNVHDCTTYEVAYGFEIHKNHKEDVVPCLGRSLPEACYEINVEFRESTTFSSKYSYLAMSILVCGILGLLIFKKNLGPEPKMVGKESKFIPLGNFQFFPEKQLIKTDLQEILLTSKENQVLKIFALNPNEPINREQLQKEVWENEGVVVGRSLDVFISKLRKKLETDPSVRIVNIHGKGYKLEID